MTGGTGSRPRLGLLGASVVVTILVAATWVLGSTTAWSHGEAWRRFWTWSDGLVPANWICLSLVLGLPAGLALGWVAARRGASGTALLVTGLLVIAVSVILGIVAAPVAVATEPASAYSESDGWTPDSLLLDASLIFASSGLVVGTAQAAGLGLGFAAQRVRAGYRAG
jgi:hypothetical protein